MSKRLYVINLWGRGGEIHFHELTKAGYQMTYNREWEFENWWGIDDIELDRMKKCWLWIYIKLLALLKKLQI